MKIASLKTDSVECHFDEKTRVATIIYHETVKPEATSAAYEWMNQSISQGLEMGLSVRGSIMDFQNVGVFAPLNLSRASQESKELHKTHGDLLNQFPTVLVVGSRYQEMMMYTSLRLSRNTNDSAYPRVKIEKTLTAARAYIEAWHTHHKTSAASAGV